MSIWTEDIFTTDNALHALGGAAISAPLAGATLEWWPTSLCVFACWFVWGMLREQAQKGTWSPSRLFRLHPVMEALAWPVGSSLLHVPLAFA